MRSAPAPSKKEHAVRREVSRRMLSQTSTSLTQKVLTVMAFAFIVLAATPSPSPSSKPTEVTLVDEVLTAKPVPSDIFAAVFLAQVSGSQLNSIRDQVVSPMGAFVRATGSNGDYTAQFTGGQLTVLIHLDENGKIDGLRFTNPVLLGGSFTDTLEEMRELPGAVSYLIVKNGREENAYGQDSALSVGSTFKLAVLNALRHEIDAGKRHWSDVVRLKGSWKSLPSGVYQTWPDGTALTLQTLATEMISVSDNTAADALASVVGRSAIRPFAGGNDPFLTTRQVFTLKSTEGAALRARYLRGTVSERRAIIAQLDRLPLPPLSSLDEDPSLNGIDWHYSNRDLCELMAGVEDLPLMTVNPGVANSGRWKRIAYKGGSDWGVVSLTTWLQAFDGATYCVSATWNDRNVPVDNTKFELLYQRLLAALAPPR